MRTLIFRFLAVVIFCASISGQTALSSPNNPVSSTRYLLQTGVLGGATWRPVSSNEVLVDLNEEGKSFNEWFDGLSATAGDEIWVINGIYHVTGTTTIKDGVNIYGGFRGTESGLSDRLKLSGGYPWEFEYTTTIDGGEVNKGFYSGNLTNETYLDGFTIANCKSTVGSGAEIGSNTIVKNCIIQDSEATSTVPNAGGGVRLNGGTLLYSYINNNVASQGGAGGVSMQSTSLVKGCVIERNSSLLKDGGGINIVISGGATIDSCFITNNTATKGGGVNAYFANAMADLNLINTQIINNTATVDGGGIHLGISSTKININNCIFKSNNANSIGGAIRVNNATTEFNKCIFTNNSSKGGGGAIYNQSLNPLKMNNCIITNNSSPNNTIYLKNNTSNSIYNTTIASNSGNVINFVTVNMVNTSLKNVLIHNNEKPIMFAAETTDYPSITYTAFDSDVSAEPYYGTGCINNLTSTNTFINPMSFQGVYTNANDSLLIEQADWNLLYDSPALNAGQVIGEVTTDLLSVSRPQGGAYDIGAYELPYFNTTVNFNVGGRIDGLTSGEVLSDPRGKPLSFTIIPDAGQQVASVKYNDMEVKEALNDGVYIAPALNANSTLIVEFAPISSLEETGSQLKCYTTPESIELSGLSIGDTVEAYNINGYKEFLHKSFSQNLSVPVSRGVYIVKVDSEVRKVIVN